jgi:hypothetical protein
MFEYNKLQELYASIGAQPEVVTAMVSLAVVLDRQGLTADQKLLVYNLLSEAGRDSLKKVPEKVVAGEWKDFDYGNVKIGDYVRVKPDAYDSPSGMKHNGRVGILKYMAHNRCTVDYIGEDLGNAMKHPMEMLDSLRLL